MIECNGWSYVVNDTEIIGHAAPEIYIEILYLLIEFSYSYAKLNFSISCPTLTLRINFSVYTASVIQLLNFKPRTWACYCLSGADPGREKESDTGKFG